MSKNLSITQPFAFQMKDGARDILFRDGVRDGCGDFGQPGGLKGGQRGRRPKLAAQQRNNHGAPDQYRPNTTHKPEGEHRSTHHSNAMGLAVPDVYRSVDIHKHTMRTRHPATQGSTFRTVASLASS